jgi:aminoglycoside 6'-N-acetyltransferase I
MITIRDFRPDDFDGCTKLFIQVFRQAPWNDDWSLERAKLYLRDIVMLPNFYGVVAQNESEIIGMCWGHIKRWWVRDEFYVDEMCVASERQRQGIGQQILIYAKQKLGEQDVSELTLLTARDSAAESFYQKQGFVVLKNLVFMKCSDGKK